MSFGTAIYFPNPLSPLCVPSDLLPNFPHLSCQAIEQNTENAALLRDPCSKEKASAEGVFYFYVDFKAPFLALFCHLRYTLYHLPSKLGLLCGSVYIKQG